MRFQVALFAYLRERHGDSVTIEAERTAADALAALADRGIDVKHCRLAVDEAFVTGAEELHAASRLALIPPVSGG